MNRSNRWRSPYGIAPWLLMGMAAILLGLFPFTLRSFSTDWVPLAVFAVICPFLIALAGDVRKFFLAVILLDIPFAIDKSFEYDVTLTPYGTTVGFNFSLTSIALIVLFGLWFVQSSLRREPLPVRPVGKLTLPLLLYLFFCILSITAAKMVKLSLFELVILVQILLLFIYVVATVRTEADIRFLVAAMMVVLILESMTIILLGVTGQGFKIAGVSGEVNALPGSHISSRIGGTLGSPILAASYLELSLPAALAVFLTNLNLRYKILAGVAFGLGGLALILTFSRAAWGVMLVTTLILLIILRKKKVLNWGLILVLMAGALLMGAVFGQAILSRILGYDLGSAANRIPLIRLAWLIIKDHPILGVGMNNFGWVLPDYVTPDFYGTFLYAVHNKYLLVLAETGIGGLITFLWFLASVLKWSGSVWRDRDPLLAPLALGLGLGGAAQMVHMLVDVFHSRPQVEQLWFVAAVLAAIYLVQQEKKKC